ncbi:putative fructosyl amino acid oxidasesarcosine oxidase [Talaromyces proteolyticus]|uniref:Fructosyl amino acid oxidasesarcosine oxidase n=1 Tax=Talaromyces proteolyticus TaxID=1131652 RepID=A0AAD4PZ71_9EURO|nr:putative fructosyl amino acid oxidasesarcosine oxidase [Talaromyces proteolyticus]KAH8695369.1 putative fructosyl amino acid oxidasesarcosine oxidase [Talaromyces proteolyticus]
MALPDSILIVGGGVFGLSTALSLSERHPTKQITLLEASPTIPNPHGSSVDTSRIIRADYANPAYAALAASAIRKWRATEWGQDGRYTENGLVLVYSDGNRDAEKYTRDSYENVRRLEGDEKVVYLPNKAAVEKSVPRYIAGMNVAGGYLNRGSGWGDAEAGVRYARQMLEEKGRNVTIKHGEVERLIFADGNGERRITGVSLKSSKGTPTIITVDLVILATGAWTPNLIDLRGIAQATGQVLAYIKITDEEQEQLADMPTILSFATGMFIIPPRNNELKIARHAYGYWNPKTVTLPQRKGRETMVVSVPENGVPIPPEGENACRQALREMLPAFANRPFTRTRVCWYTDTPRGDFLISYHPEYSNLFLATGGSGHGYKFFPILGDKIVDALEGKLDPELRQLWQWPEAQHSLTPVVTKDGSRSGAMGLNLMDELAKSRVESPKL